MSFGTIYNTVFIVSQLVILLNNQWY